MTWHGPIPIKMIEKDVKIDGRQSYFERIDRDNKKCDLMLSCSTFTTSLIRNAMDYKGEVLEEGLPRNDIFFKVNLFEDISNKIKIRYGIKAESKIVLYAPTFRTDHTIDSYNIEWDTLVPCISNLFNGRDFVVLYRLHPDLNISVNIDPNRIVNLVNVSDYPDMQELLCISDVLITDYSSSMFEFAMLKRPCFIYASDYDSYDRSFYFNIKKLPFPFASDNDGLKENLIRFNLSEYQKILDYFMTERIGLFDKYNACESLCLWMQSHKS